MNRIDLKFTKPYWAESLESKIDELTTQVAKMSVKIDILQEGIEYIKNCHMHENTRKGLDKILSREGAEL